MACRRYIYAIRCIIVVHFKTSNLHHRVLHMKSASTITYTSKLSSIDTIPGVSKSLFVVPLVAISQANSPPHPDFLLYFDIMQSVPLLIGIVQ